MDLCRVRALALALLSSLPGTAAAFTDQGHAAAGISQKVLRPGLKAASQGATLGEGATLEVDARSGAPRLVSAREFAGVAPVAFGAPRDAYVAEARAFVEANRAVVGAAWSDLALVENSVLIDADVAFLDFDVRRNGVLVADANVAFRFKTGRLVQVQTQSFGEVEGASAKGADLFRVTETEGGYRLVPVVRQNLKLGGEFVEAQVEVATGEVFDTIPERHYAEGGGASALVYPRTWFDSTTQLTPISEATLRIGNSSSVTTDVAGNFAATSAPRLNGFSGPRANVVPSTGTLVQKTAVARGADFELVVDDTTEKSLSQAMAFHHVNHAVNYAKKYISTDWFTRALRVNVNLSQTCNAYWDGSTINFYSAGRGCANTALVSDVVYHEWGHGLDANTGGISDGAFSEGYGDIIAMIMARDSVTAPGFRSDGRGIRDLAPNKIYPQDRGEVHAEGLIIGGTFWDLYQALAEKYDDDAAIELVSKYAFKVIFTARRYTDVYAALQVIDDDDGDLRNKTPNFCELNDAFTAHGLATADATCARGN